MEPSYSPPPYAADPIVTDLEPDEPPAPGATWTDRVPYSRAAFYAGLTGGMLILLGAFITALFLTAMATFGGTLPPWAWDMDGEPGRGDGWPEVPIFIGVWGLLMGGIVLVAALAVRDRPERAAGPGLALITAGVLSFFALGGFILGGLFAIGAGVLAIAGSRSIWRAGGARLRDRELAQP